MTDAHEQMNINSVDAAAVARAHAVYTPLALVFYDLVVHGLSNRFAWRCPTSRLHGLYEESISANHLEVGAGTGLFLDRADTSFDRLVLLDINRNCLERSGRRLARFRPEFYEANLLVPIEHSLAPFDSVGLTYVLHCLPGSMSEKLTAVDHLKPMMADGAVLFGATILGRGIAPNAAAKALLDLYNSKGVFHNCDDGIAALTEGLEERFSRVEVEEQGCVALFRAWVK